MCDINNTAIFSPCWFKDSIYWSFSDGIFTIVSILILVFGAIKLFHLRNYWRLRNYSKKKDTIVVIGLGENNRVYIDSELEEKYKQIIVIEKNKDNPYIETYIKKGIGVKVGDATDIELIRSINLLNTRHVLVSVGNDMNNLEVTTQILDEYENANVYIHIEDRSLRHFHKENGIFKSSNIKIFSYYEDASRALFDEYDIDGDDFKIIKSNEAFSIVVVGNTNLAYEVISQACIVGQLPNENKLTIYCIDKNIKEFQQGVELNYTQIDKIPNIEIIYKQLDYNSKEFYEEYFWKYLKNLTNIILCFESDQLNLDIAANIANITYKDRIADEELETKILIAMFNDYNLSMKLKENASTFKNYFVFGNKNKICNKKYLIGEERDKVAKAVAYFYDKVQPVANENDSNEYRFKYRLGYDDDSPIIDSNQCIDINDEPWKKLSYFDKESNRAVSDHLKTKLKYLGLTYIKDINNFSLFDLNKLNREELMKYFSDEYLLAKLEHTRWNTFHYLNGYTKIDLLTKKEKDALKVKHALKKQHMCLIDDFAEFKENEKYLTEEMGYGKWHFESYDFMINNFIPNMLAYTRYRIKPIINLGVTGHREVDKSIIDVLEKELLNLFDAYYIHNVFSPLAEGTDRIVAKLCVEKKIKLIAPLPFLKKEYKNDFDDESKKDFNEILEKSYTSYVLDTEYNVEEVQDNSHLRNQLYKNVGEHVVDNCDILIAVWDGKDSNGIGGTAEIVNYANQQNKKILHINSDTKKVIKINWII